MRNSRLFLHAVQFLECIGHSAAWAYPNGPHLCVDVFKCTIECFANIFGLLQNFLCFCRLHIIRRVFEFSRSNKESRSASRVKVHIVGICSKEYILCAESEVWNVLGGEFFIKRIHFDCHFFQCVRSQIPGIDCAKIVPFCPNSLVVCILLLQRIASFLMHLQCIVAALILAFVDHHEQNSIQRIGIGEAAVNYKFSILRRRFKPHAKANDVFVNWNRRMLHRHLFKGCELF